MADPASATLLFSIILRLCGVAISVVLLYRVRDLRFGFLTLMLSLMALRQTFTLFGLFPSFAELPGLVVSVLAVALVYYLLQYTRQEEAVKAELTETNRRLREHRNHLEATVAASPDEVFLFDSEARFETVLSNAGDQGSGRRDGRGPGPERALEGRTIHDVRPDDVAEEIAAAIDATIRTGETERVEYSLRRDGDVRWYEGRTARVEHSDGEQRVLFSRRDVTDRVEREQALRRFRRAVDAAGAAVYITDHEGEIRYVNPAFEEITGYDREEAIGTTPRILSSGKLDEEYYDDLWETILSGETWREEIVNQRRSGDLYHAEQTIAPVVDDDGTVEEFVAIQIDITERHDRERQLLVLDRVLRHNLHNDMTIILGHAETIEEKVDDEEVADSAAIIREEGETLLTKVEKEREIVTLLADSPSPRPIDLVEIVEDSAERARTRWPDATIVVDAPDAVTARAIEDAARAIDELIENAISHCDRTPRVELTVEPTPRSVLVRVADNGPGIPEQVRGVITDGQEIESLYHGSGLGLWFVRWVLRLSGGSVTFEENDPRGSVVVLAFERRT